MFIKPMLAHTPPGILGVEMARGEWVAFFDDDQWAEPGWLAELYRVAQEKEADCVGGAVFLDLPESSPGNWGREPGEPCPRSSRATEPGIMP